MPIRPELRWFYPIDWTELSRLIRFGRARGRCETCGRPHGTELLCLRNGQWYDPELDHWRDGRGRRMPAPAPEQAAQARRTRVVLAAAHLDHNPANNHHRNLRSLCQRCHMLHDRPHHLAQRRITYRRRWALGDLFTGPYWP
jgi:hypothetical protein